MEDAAFKKMAFLFRPLLQIALLHKIARILVYPPIMIAIALALSVYITNRSRLTLEEAIQRTGGSENELRELIQEKLLPYRRKYVVFGPLTIDTGELAEARAAHPEIKRIRAEIDATLRQTAEDIIAQTRESNRFYQEQARIQQEEMERMERVYAEILRSFKTQQRIIPPDVARALQRLDLPEDASLSDIRQRYRLLAKRSHPDAGGDHEQFIQINEAYKRVITWITSQN